MENNIMDISYQIFERPYFELNREQKDDILDIKWELEEKLKEDTIIKIDDKIEYFIRKLNSYKKKRKDILGLVKCTIQDYLNILTCHNEIMDSRIQIKFIGYKYLNVSVELKFWNGQHSFEKIYRIGIASHKELYNKLINAIEYTVLTNIARKNYDY